MTFTELHGSDVMIVKLCKESKICSVFQQELCWRFVGEAIFCVRHQPHLSFNNFWYTSTLEFYGP